MELQFLGTGAGMPSKLRNTTSIVLNLSAEERGYWMFDCGEATQHQMLHTTLKPRKVNKLFITHLHGDHLFGIPGFIGSRSFLGGDDPLDIYGPPGIEEWIRTTLRLTRTHLMYDVRYHEFHEDGLLFEDDDFTVTAALLAHVVPSYGFRIEQKPRPGTLLIDKALEAGVPKGPLLQQLKNGRDVTLDDGKVVRSASVIGEPKDGFTIAILGDTSDCTASRRLAERADIVVHEATFDEETGQLASDFGHSTIRQAAAVARDADAKALIATHISSRFMPGDLQAFKEEGQAVFPNVFVANDFSQYTLQDGEVKETAFKKS
ncbi:ribonuclease Z [Sporosarcina sp. NCCP-2716]|uniref:ribonuclease Z n=1 Tax=Sporosarcina sp. NCCP-2716 TaxID=2943679 RepID=UPI00203E79D2|nr:ribonuclease Z [Sporosarcina sp. NCCP-2716]GKV68149.1 ribonuclease Z [Sporosarcina sp. NCCP-2716]